MKAVLTRVSEASVTVDGDVVGAINCAETGGILALVGVGREDDEEAWQKMARKIAELRILDGEKSVEDVNAAFSQPVHAFRPHCQGSPPIVGRRCPWRSCGANHRKDRVGTA